MFNTRDTYNKGDNNKTNVKLKSILTSSLSMPFLRSLWSGPLYLSCQLSCQRMQKFLMANNHGAVDYPETMVMKEIHRLYGEYLSLWKQIRWNH